MKRSINFFLLAGSLSLSVLVSCKAKDYNNESTTTVTDTVANNTQSAVPEPVMTNGDTSANAAAAKQTPATPATKTKKVKATTVMMTSSGKSTAMNQDKSGYYSSVEVLPMFPGGQNALDNFVNNNIEYPANATDNGIEGKVTVNFAVDEMGKVSNPKIVGKPLGYGLEDEVLRVVNKMPTWTPGIIKGKNVKTYYTLPINFKIEE